MLEWFTSSTRAADTQVARADDGESYVEEAPATPAPLFAVRAFKTAIFGTPHPDQSDVKSHASPAEEIAEALEKPFVENVKEIQAQKAKNYINEPVAVSKVNAPVSPTKGILLTPGTGTTRRKTVSFGTFLADTQMNEKNLLSTEAKIDSAPKSRQNPKASPRIQPRHSSLTKTLIELSKPNADSQAMSATSSEEESCRESASSTGTQPENKEQITDSTVDLNQPRSRSGKHWKTEYELYHKRSNREMKKIIMYGQNVKSYAVKKDSEATDLGEKLKKELSKVAAMEKKVSKLAAQLNDAYAHGPERESEQTRLVSELAQQTALAIRYKQKVDRYRRAMRKGNSGEDSHSEQDDTCTVEESCQESHREAHPPRVVHSPELDILHAEVESLRMSAKKAEDQAANLEAENNALKRSLARVKGEMMSYETRRQAREERFKRREAKCKADQKACEAQLAKLTLEHQNLLLACGRSSSLEALAHQQSTACYHGPKRPEEKPKSSEGALAIHNKLDRVSPGQNRVSKPHISPRKNRSQKSAVDIWTLSSPSDAVDAVSPSKEPTELPPSSVRHDIQRTLKEIDQNLIPEQNPGTEESSSKPPLPQDNRGPESYTQIMPQPQSDTSLPIHHARNQRPPSTSPPRPAMVDLTTGPAQGGPSEAILKPSSQKSIAAVGRSSSLMSGVGSRTSTMTSGRGSALSAERALAAKARLAARSAEKKSKGLESRG